ncbi:hypothetical protein SAV14893_031880 [Streptomyces avermitilis]|uniref:Uncharacterized protein n=1 Tax=Streptomyces avermitilis TaxID=33903 RepID=A0A4D4LS34_STRAX|nr:hypothetical protein SAV14893_031880 [Streptomyces avermitilis]GDY85014.1 hypothetical protein SAVCW2_42130 [Streptomyces avermitilis]
MGGQLGLEVGGVGAAGGLHLHAGLDEGPQLVGKTFEVGALPQQHEDRLDRVGAVEGACPVAAKTSMEPSEKTSLAPVTLRESFACSGDM